MPTGWGREVRRAFQNIATQNAAGKTFTTPFAALCTTNPNDDGSGNNVAGTTEPSTTGGYARQAISWSAPSLPSADGSCIAQNSVAISWGPSAAAWSTGASNLTYVAIYTSSSLATVTESAFLGRAQIAVPQAVNSAGITLTIAIGGLQMGCVSA